MTEVHYLGARCDLAGLNLILGDIEEIDFSLLPGCVGDVALPVPSPETLSVPVTLTLVGATFVLDSGWLPHGVWSIRVTVSVPANFSEFGYLTVDETCGVAGSCEIQYNAGEFIAPDGTRF